MSPLPVDERKPRSVDAMRRAFAGAALTVAALGGAGCSVHTEAYPGVPADQLWTAMKAAALEPSYPDWVVLENAVEIDESDQTIEVLRQLRRDVHMPGVTPRREDQEWRFSIALEAPPPPEAPEVRFMSRTASLPTSAIREADRYFADVHTLLSPPALHE